MEAGVQGPPGAFLCGKISGEEAAVVCAAGCTEGTGREPVVKHADLVAVVSGHAPEAAVTGKATTMADSGRAS